MKHFAFLLIVAFAMSLTTVRAQGGDDAGGNTDPPTDQPAGNSDDATTNSPSENNNDDTTPATNTGDDADNTTASTSDNTTAGGVANVTVPPLTLVPPMLEDACKKVYENCTGSAMVEVSACSTWEDDLSGCLHDGITNNAGDLLECSDDDITKVAKFCFASKLVNSAATSGVSQNCQKHVVEVVSAEADIHEEEGAFCSFLDDNEDELLEAMDTQAAADMKCTAEEFDAMHQVECFACRGTMASLGLIVAMVAAQMFVINA